MLFTFDERDLIETVSAEARGGSIFGVSHAAARDATPEVAVFGRSLAARLPPKAPPEGAPAVSVGAAWVRAWTMRCWRSNSAEALLPRFVPGG
jgi:hypothetical protein